MADGWHLLSGELSPEHGESFRVVLDAFVDRHLRDQRDGDPSLAQMPVPALRAQALADLVAQTPTARASDASAPDRDRVAVVVNADRSKVDGSPACCDATMFRVVLGAAGELLDVGRASREWPPAIRRAIGLRDGGCVFPGCDRPPSWCDIHHCTPWEAGGDTALRNAAMHSRRHLTFVHAKRWTGCVTGPRGKPEVRRPDGPRSVIDRSQWPPLPRAG
jgi:hypothetical protein